MTVFRKCDGSFFVSWWREVKGLQEVHDRKCDSHKGGVKGIKNECQLMERCDGHGGGGRGWRVVMVIGEV